MVTKIQKWGNSLGLRLPKKLAEDLDMGSGTEVDLSIVKGRLVLTPIKSTKLSLSDLLKKVKPDNLHGESDFGGRRGLESW